jgi:biotin synthase
LGETPLQWLELVFILRELEVDCIPINTLNPRPGTPLENMIPPPPLEVIKLIAITRLIVPDVEIKLAGGREVNLKDFQATAFLAGVTGMIVGGYLTTKGRCEEDDCQMLKDLELA